MLKRLMRRIIERLADELDYVRNDTRKVAFGRRGEGLRISYSGKFVQPQGIHIGDYVYIGPHAFFDGSGTLTIGDNVAIGPHVYIYTSNHNYEGAGFIPFDEVIDRRGVTIGSHIWIGGNVVIVRA